MKNKIFPTLALGIICLVVVLLLAAVNTITAPLIEKAQAEKVQKALAEVMPTGVNFTSIEVDGLPEEITKVYSEDGGGYVFQMSVVGYKPGLVILCGIDANGIITGAEFVESKETLSAEVGLGKNFIGHTSDTVTPELVAGSTAKKTTGAYYAAIEAALTAFEMITEKEDTQ